MYIFKIATHHANGGRTTLQESEISVPIQTHQSPVVLALHKLEEIAKLNRKQKTHTYRLKKTLQHLCLTLLDAFNVPLSDHTRDSFTDLLYAVEQAIDRCTKSPGEKIANWQAFTALLRLVHQPMGDGAKVSDCLRLYSKELNYKSSLTGKTALKKLAVIPHEDFKDLEKKAIQVTEELVTSIIKACERDIDEYLRICEKQNNFTRYYLNDLIKSRVASYSKSGHLEYIKNVRDVDVLKAFCRLISEKDSLKFEKYGNNTDFGFPHTGTLRILEGFVHYSYRGSLQPWWLCRYRLPNYVLASCYLLLLAKTGWNIASVGSLTINDIKKFPNGSYEIQARKDKTDDDTTKIIISKADKYFKACLSLLTWNHSQLVKYKLISDSDDNIWYGWQITYKKPLYPLDGRRLEIFFSHHHIPAIPPSDIRPVKSSFNFLKHYDLEMVRVLLGHSSLDTTKLYLQNNLIFHLNEARILEFQKRLESTIAHETNSPENFNKRGFNQKKVHPSLIGRTSSQDTAMEVKLINEAKEFLTSIGVESINEESVVTVETLTQAVLLKNYYRLRWRQIFDKNPHLFVSHHINVMLYIHVFLKVAQERKPLLVQTILTKIGAEPNE
jgi:hypothetical protein